MPFEHPWVAVQLKLIILSIMAKAASLLSFAATSRLHRCSTTNDLIRIVSDFRYEKSFAIHGSRIRPGRIVEPTELVSS